MPEPTWSKVKFPPIDYQDSYYYSPPKSPSDGPKSLDEVDPKLLETYAKLAFPLSKQKLLAGVAFYAVFDSVSAAASFRHTLVEAALLFCSLYELGRAARREK